MSLPPSYSDAHKDQSQTSKREGIIAAGLASWPLRRSDYYVYTYVSLRSTTLPMTLLFSIYPLSHWLPKHIASSLTASPPDMCRHTPDPAGPLRLNHIPQPSIYESRRSSGQNPSQGTGGMRISL